MPPKEKRRRVDTSDLSSHSEAAAASVSDWRWHTPLLENFFLVSTADVRGVWELALELSKKDPCAAFAPLGLRLCGPFDMLAGKSKAEGLPWFLHSRHPFDPPEIVTVVEVVGSKPLHWGYHRDAPETRPRCVVASVPDKKHKRGRFDELAPTLLDAMTSHGQTFVSKLRDGDKDRKEAAKSCLQRVVAAAKALPAASSPFRRPIDTTLNKLGIAVPYDKKTEVGWRELSVSDAELQAYLEKLLETKARGESPNFTELDRLITFANIANDECDPGQALKLGLDLFTVVELDSDTANLLTPTYKLLNRDKFAEVIEAHTAGDRRRSGETSILVD